MKKLMPHAFLIFFTFFSPMTLNADFYRQMPSRLVASPSLLFSSDTLSINGKAESDHLHVDFRLGYQSTYRWYFGFLYSHESKSYKTAQAISETLNKDNFSQSYFGGSIGYNLYGIYVIGSALFAAELEYKGQAPAINKNFSAGYGFQVDLGTHLALTSSIYVGPRISYRMIYYDNNDVVYNPPIDELLTQSSLTPHFVLWIEFE